MTEPTGDPGRPDPIARRQRRQRPDVAPAKSAADIPDEILVRIADLFLEAVDAADRMHHVARRWSLLELLVCEFAEEEDGAAGKLTIEAGTDATFKVLQAVADGITRITACMADGAADAVVFPEDIWPATAHPLDLDGPALGFTIGGAR